MAELLSEKLKEKGLVKLVNEFLVDPEYTNILGHGKSIQDLEQNVHRIYKPKNPTKETMCYLVISEYTYLYVKNNKCGFFVDDLDNILESLSATLYIKKSNVGKWKTIDIKDWKSIGSFFDIYKKKNPELMVYISIYNALREFDSHIEDSDSGKEEACDMMQGVLEDELECVLNKIIKFYGVNIAIVFDGSLY